MLIAQEKLTLPDFASILLVGPPKSGKTASIATLRRVLRQRKLPTRIAFYDMDEDGSDTLLRLARNGYESNADAIAKRNHVDPWTDDIELHKFTTKGLRVKDAVTPARRQDIAIEFIKEFNELFDRLDTRTQSFREKPIGAVIVDSITGLTDMFEDFVFGFRNREIGGEKDAAITFNDWRLMAEKVMEVYKSAKSLPCYSVFTAHVETRQEVIRNPSDKTGNSDIATHNLYDVPLVTGQLRERIAKDFGVVLYTTPDYKWRTRPGNKVRSAGSRGKDSLPPEIDQDFREVLDM